MSQAESSLLKCLNCGARGTLHWQEGGAHAGTRRTLAKVSGEFHIESGRTVPDSRLLVCGRCDEIYGVLPAGRTNP